MSRIPLLSRHLFSSLPLAVMQALNFYKSTLQNLSRMSWRGDPSSSLAKLHKKTLKESGSGLCDIVRVRVFVPNPDHVLDISSVLKDRIGFTKPANTTVCSPLAVSGAHVEIEVEAIRGSGEIIVG